MKNFLKQLVPPLFAQFYRKIKSHNPPPASNVWSGNYSSWYEATQHSSGYDNKEIMEKCRNSLLKVKQGEAKYERDSVLFDEIEYSWPLLAGLQHIALENSGKLSVLDFGGSFGSTYFQNKSFLSNLSCLNWNIVEQEMFVKEGKLFFEDNILKFFNTITESTAFCKADVAILSSVLQYLEFPYEVLDELFHLKIPYIIIDKTTFIDHPADILTIQNVPEEIYKAKYPSWFFSFENFKKRFKNYELISSFNAYEGLTIALDNGIIGTYKGFILKMKYDKRDT